jgi:hypothetical protein
LEAELLKLFTPGAFDSSERLRASWTVCSISFEHAESSKILITTGNFTSATAVVRLQYEALVRAMWLLYAASDTAVTKLMAELTSESAHRANKTPLLSEMLTKLEGKAPQEALSMLNEFKEYSWKPLSSFVHGGIHAITRHNKGYPAPLLEQLLKASNGVSVMTGMMLVILSGSPTQQGKITTIQATFQDCLPDHKPSH